MGGRALPRESVREARAGETVSRWGVRWTVEVTRVPRTNKPGRVMLQVTVRLTPENQKAIDDFVPPNVEFRDTAGRTWVTIVPPEGSVYRSDLKVGRTARMTAYGVVPEELADTAKVALVSTGESAGTCRRVSRARTANPRRPSSAGSGAPSRSPG